MARTCQGTGESKSKFLLTITAFRAYTLRGRRDIHSSQIAHSNLGVGRSEASGVVNYSFVVMGHFRFGRVVGLNGKPGHFIGDKSISFFFLNFVFPEMVFFPL